MQVQGKSLTDLVVHGLDDQPLEGTRVQVFVNAVLLREKLPLLEQTDLWVSRNRLVFFGSNTRLNMS